jgi:hypothetical protein
MTANRAKRIRTTQANKSHSRAPFQRATRNSRDEAIPPWFRNWTLLAGVISVSFVAVRLLGVAAGNPETAYAILQSQGTASVIVGSIIPQIGIFALPTSFVLVSAAENRKFDHLTRSILLILGMASFVIALFTAPAIFTGISIVGAFMLACMYELNNRMGNNTKESTRQSRKWWRPAGGLILVVYIAFSLAQAAVFPNPWLPSEQIVIKNHTSITGYVLSQNTGLTTILVKNPVSVIQVPSGSISGQTICRTSDYFFYEETVNEFFGNFISRVTVGPLSGTYPPCGR